MLPVLLKLAAGAGVAALAISAAVNKPVNKNVCRFFELFTQAISTSSIAQASAALRLLWKGWLAWSGLRMSEECNIFVIFIPPSKSFPRK